MIIAGSKIKFISFCLRDEFDLDLLLNSLKSVSKYKDNKKNWSIITTADLTSQEQRELGLLEGFAKKYHDERNFSRLKQKKIFSNLLCLIVKNRLQNKGWLQSSHAKLIHYVLLCLRYLLRDVKFLEDFIDDDSIGNLVELFNSTITSYYEAIDNYHLVDIILELTSKCY